MMFVRSIRLPACLALVCFLSALSLFAAENGRDIYRQHCAKCHGRKGEGVPKKYEDALYGDWSLDRLSRYIDRNMPEDDPDKCNGAEAVAVAKYIYDAFYSPEARLRNNPPRVELVRLTNRQYLNSVADLVKHFTGAGGALTSERGLKGTYYESRDFNKEKKINERVDRHLNFDFGQGNPDQEHAFTNGFSMQWRGSLIAEETGDYEFILKTPNGARLWVNDEVEPIIDAWVSSGELREHKATVRLIGGRVYPLQVNYFKYKEKQSSISLHWTPPHGARDVIPVRNLSTSRPTPTLVIATPFPPDDSSVGYERGVGVSRAWDEAATQGAIEAANYVARNLDRLTRSKPADTNRAEKVEAFCREFVKAAFRRPLTDEQKQVFVSAHFEKARTAEDAVKRVVLLALKSPRFLYLGLEAGAPDDFAVAERLAFELWDSLPDKELIKAASDGRLRTKEQVVQQANRLLRDPRAQAKLQHFLHHWLQMNRAEDLAKDATLYPGFTPEIIADLRTSLNLFLEDSAWNGTSDYRTLLLADYLFVNNRLSEFYGLATNTADDDFVKVMLDPKERSGVLTHPYLLAAFSYQKSSSPIHRGVFLTRNIVGRALKPPPMAQVFNEADFAPHLTMREKVSELTRSSACQTCHSVINPLGFSLEHYDAVGRFRTVERDRPIDVVSEYVTDDGQAVRLSGARDVAEFAVGNEQAQKSFIEQLFHQVVKQPVAAYGPGTMEQLRQSFVASGFNVRKLLVDIAAVSVLHQVEPVSAKKT